MRLIPSVLFVFLLASVLLFYASSCKKIEGCMDPTASNYDADAEKNCCCTYHETLKMDFNFEVAGTALDYDKEYNAVAGRNYDFSLVQFYISEVTLHGAENNVQLEDSYFLINLDETEHLSVDQEMQGSYSSISFNVGIDTVTNNTQQPSDFDTGHPLSAQSPIMWWSWNSGYIFFKLEGMVDTTATPDNTLDDQFAYHIGLNPLLQRVQINTPISIEEGDIATIQITVDPSQFFNGIDLAHQRKTHTMNNLPLATKVSDNVPLVFSIK